MTGSNHRGAGPIALLRNARLVPVLTITDVDHAVPLARALVAGGIRTLEITLRTKAGAAAAKAIHEEVPEAIVGLGTVCTPADLKLCKSLGLRFAFSPGASPTLLAAAADMNLEFVPGVQTASEIMTCLEWGFDVVNFFPAVPAGGIEAVKSLAGPFPHVVFYPSGGITEEDAPRWLALKNVAAVGGSWLVSADMVEAGDWHAITARAKQSMASLAASPRIAFAHA